MNTASRMGCNVRATPSSRAVGMFARLETEVAFATSLRNRDLAGGPGRYVPLRMCSTTRPRSLRFRVDSTARVIIPSGPEPSPTSARIWKLRYRLSREAIYRRIVAGMPGTPHPAVSNLPQEQVIELVDYVLSLAREPPVMLTNHERRILATTPAYLDWIKAAFRGSVPALPSLSNCSREGLEHVAVRRRQHRFDRALGAVDRFRVRPGYRRRALLHAR